MTQRHVVILFIVIIFIGLGIAGASKVRNEINFSPSPAPISPESPEGKVKGEETVDNLNEAEYLQQGSKMIKRYSNFPGEFSLSELSNQKAIIETDKGIIEFEIYPEAKKAASNFIFLAKDSFYDGLTFHRVEPGFVIQGGDPLGNGSGGPGYRFEDDPVTKSYTKGIVAMANAGPNTNGSQFFIMLEDNFTLPPNYSIFGKVISGQEVVEKITVGDVMKKVSIASKD